ncbi:MAG: tetratricopeptide repeat protein [bacterium]
MFDLIPQTIIIISIAGIIVVIARKIPQLSLLEEKKVSDVSGDKKAKTPRFANKVWLKIKGVKHSQHFHKLLDITEKFLRKLKVFFLKLENKITGWAEGLRQHSQKVKLRREGIEIQVKPEDNFDAGNSEEISINEKAVEKTVIQEEGSLEEKYIAAITKNPRDLEAYRNLGNLYFKKDNVDDARDAFRQILKINPADSNAEMMLRKLRTRKVRKI